MTLSKTLQDVSFPVWVSYPVVTVLTVDTSVVLLHIAPGEISTVFEVSSLLPRSSRWGAHSLEKTHVEKGFVSPGKGGDD